MKLRSTNPSEDTYPLSPFQRASLAYSARPITLIVDVPLAPEVLVERATQVLRGSPELTAVLRHAPASLVPHQAASDIKCSSLPRGGADLVAGNLRMTAEPVETGTRLTIATDAVTADAVSIELFCERTARGADVRAWAPFFVVAAEHAAMLQEGELDQEKAHWSAIPRDEEPRSALGVAAGTTGQRATATVPIDAASLSTFAATHNVEPGEVLYLALQLLIDRVCPDSATFGWLFDARELMGLKGRSGPLTQILLDHDKIDPDATATTLLKRQLERRSKHAEMAGGPALTEKSAPPTIVFDARSRWQLPEGWRFVDAFEGRSGALVLRGSLDGAGLSLVAHDCDGADSAVLFEVLAAWADIISAVVREPQTPWKSLQLGAKYCARGLHVPPPSIPDRPRADDICARMSMFIDDDPEAIAVYHGDRLVTRRDLMSRVRDLAAALGQLDPGMVIAVLAGPELDLLAGWLAVLWRGAAFLPLLPTEPPHRIEKALTDSAACAILVGGGAPPFSAPIGCRVVHCSDVAQSSHPMAPVAATDPEHIGYVLRTSGSSGTPKLVAIRRESLNNYLRWVAEDVLADGSDLPVVSSPIFDASFKQLLGPQYAGRATWLLEADPVNAAQAYSELADAKTPLVLNCTPTYWAELLDIGTNEGRHISLRKLLLGGEHISDTLRRRTTDEYPLAEIWNLYGPTETTATATAGHVKPDDPMHAGSALAGAVVTVSDRYGRELPLGMRGEIWISGPGVAKGYLGGVDQGPFVDLQVGERTLPSYRTGDTGVLDDQGRLRLFGRRDSQLKLRGWRIEPQEIERVAETTPGVVNAKLLLDSRSVSHLLCLFVIGDAEVAAILKVLRDSLPAGMIPAKVVRVGRFPRTATGKLDHLALLGKLTAESGASPGDYEPLELEIATIWRGLLGQRWPRTDEDFFSAGGHSLLLARLVNQLRLRGHGISLRQIVRNPTVHSIAEAISASDAGRCDDAASIAFPVGGGDA